eukprot:2505555-Amphidinium_carterae.2
MMLDSVLECVIHPDLVQLQSGLEESTQCIYFDMVDPASPTRRTRMQRRRSVPRRCARATKGKKLAKDARVKHS